jgi:hypothetical protein
MIRKLLGVGALVLSVDAAAQQPQWLTEARATEAIAIPLREIRSVDNWFKARVPATLVGRIEKSEGSYTVELDIGAKAHLNCEIIPNGFDLADGLRVIFNNLMSETDAAGQKVETSALEQVNAGAWGSVPWLRATWLYRVNQNGDKLLGAVQQFSAEKSGHGVYCGIRELGYAKTMDAVVQSLANSLEFKSPAVPPYHQEIYVWSLRGTNLGVSQLLRHRDADGDTVSSTNVSLMFPVAGGKFISQDLALKEFIRPDDSLINAVTVVLMNGELTHNLKLQTDAGRWTLRGKHQGKELDKTLPAETSPASTVQQIRGLQRLLARENPLGAEQVLKIWDAGDLTQLSESRIRITGRAGAQQFTADHLSGKDRAVLTLEKATGGAVAGQVSVAGQTLEMRRVYTNGAL